MNIDMSDELESLVSSLAPILHFHKDEGRYCCFPTDAEETFTTFGTDWKQFKKDLAPNILDPTTPCYYETWKDEDLIQIRYWFWYRYNKFPDIPFRLGDHLGDWEHVEVRLYPKLSIGESAIWFISNHNTARVTSYPTTVTFPQFKSETSSFSDNHIHVWVAMGSHANYMSPYSRVYCVARRYCDKLSKDGSVWKTEQNLIPLSETNFVSYMGRWGDRKAPRSPTNAYNNRWRNAPNDLPIPSDRQ